LGGKVGLDIGTSLVTSLIAELGVSVEVNVSRQRCAKIAESVEMSLIISQCFNVSARFAETENSVNGDVTIICRKNMWRNIETNEVEFTDSTERILRVSAGVTTNVTTELQIAPRDCPGYTPAVPDPYQGRTSPPCCNLIKGCHIFPTPPDPCCGLRAAD